MVEIFYVARSYESYFSTQFADKENPIGSSYAYSCQLLKLYVSLAQVAMGVLPKKYY